jgi:hypothetical protein
VDPDDRPWDRLEKELRVWRRHLKGGSRERVAISFDLERIDRLLLAIRTANKWVLYAPELLRLKRTFATARLAARKGKGRRRTDAALRALGIVNPDRRRQSLSDDEAREVVDAYKTLLTTDRPVWTVDQDRLWASGHEERMLLDEPAIAVDLEGGTMVAPGPHDLRTAVDLVTKLYSDRFYSSTATTRFLEEARKRMGEDFPLPSRRRRSRRDR